MCFSGCKYNINLVDLYMTLTLIVLMQPQIYIITIIFVYNKVNNQALNIAIIYYSYYYTMSYIAVAINSMRNNLLQAYTLGWLITQVSAFGGQGKLQLR